MAFQWCPAKYTHKTIKHLILPQSDTVEKLFLGKSTTMHCCPGLQNHSYISAAYFRFYSGEEEAGQCNGTMQLFVATRCGVKRVSDKQ